MQTKKQTLVEVFTNVLIGFGGSWLITYLFMKYELMSYAETATVIVVTCTIWSIVRNYCIRRFFNWSNHRKVYAEEVISNSIH